MFKRLSLLERIFFAACELVSLLLATATVLAIALDAHSLSVAGILALVALGLIMFGILSFFFCVAFEVDA